MPNPYGAPEISVHDVARKQSAGEKFVWLDVREDEELGAACIQDDNVVHVPLSTLAEEQAAALPEPVQNQEAEIVVFCHHGMRSAQVTAWLLGQGWTNVANMDGGIDAWAREIDQSVGTY